jgi:ketosteroid isomerase-like protein
MGLANGKTVTIRRRAAWVLLALVAAAVAPAAQQRRAPVRSDQDTLIQMERDWDGAFERQDAKLIESFLAPEFIATYSDGKRGDKAMELKLVAENNQQVDKRELLDFTVKIYGQTAVVWFTQQLTGPVKGKPTTISFRYTDVWVMRDGRWLCVSSQSTRETAR